MDKSFPKRRPPPMTLRRLLKYPVFLALGLLGGGSAWLGYALLASRSPPDADLFLERLENPARVDFDEFGIPRIQAQSREDAYAALGFVTARDRLFQMDLARRNAAGRLAEVFGSAALETDRQHRIFGFTQVAAAVLAGLPAEHRKVLEAYAGGVNQAMRAEGMPPFECRLLGYAPEPWRPEDSLLVVLGMFEYLAWGGAQERSTTLMEASLPKPVLDFLLPLRDAYTDRLVPGAAPAPIPVAELAGVLERARRIAAHQAPPATADRHPGSNAWVVGPGRTGSGRAILANDMHLGLGVPGPWYRAELHYGGQPRFAGLFLPGVPMPISGSNRRVAWGFSNTSGDFTDLVRLRTNPANPHEYLTPQGPRRFETRQETIRVRWAAAHSFEVRSTLWGPVESRPLLGGPVAVRWTALDPAATNLDFLELDRADSVQAALRILNGVGGPPLNAVVADADGNIGWTLTGRVPMRFGMDGLFSRSWADGGAGWQGYIPPEQLPRRVNPPEGYIVSANQRMVGGEYPHPIGHDYAPGYRAYRITEKLSRSRAVSERDMLALQLDTESGGYRYYQQLVLGLLRRPEAARLPDAAALRAYLEAWDGRAEPGSLGRPLLMEFRMALMAAVVSPYFAACLAADPDCTYAWSYGETALRRLLDAQAPELLPEPEKYPDWNAFLLAVLERSARQLQEKLAEQDWREITWGRANRVGLSHPLAGVLPFLGPLLDMPARPLRGGDECVLVCLPGFGASERLVVSPGHDEDGLLHLPGGQSGHPLSPHYRDQHEYWAAGRPAALWTGPARRGMWLFPAGRAAP